MNVLQLSYLYRDLEHMGGDWTGKSCGDVPESLRNMKDYSGKTERNSPDRPPLPTELVSTLSAEEKNEGIKFRRIDADVTDALKSKTSKKAEEMEEQAESISKLMKKALKNDKITVKVEAEEQRRSLP